MGRTQRLSKTRRKTRGRAPAVRTIGGLGGAALGDVGRISEGNLPSPGDPWPESAAGTLRPPTGSVSSGLPASCSAAMSPRIVYPDAAHLTDQSLDGRQPEVDDRAVMRAVWSHTSVNVFHRRTQWKPTHMAKEQSHTSSAPSCDRGPGSTSNSALVAVY